MNDFRDRLEAFLRKGGQSGEIQQLTPDASTREYFRVKHDGGSAIACVYPEPFNASEQSYLDVTELFLTCGLPVAQIRGYDAGLGVILLEDFGDRILRDEMTAATPERRDGLIDDAIRLIPRIQAATGQAYAMNSIASRLSFDVEKLKWELDFFRSHYFGSISKEPLLAADAAALDEEFLRISRALENRATVLCHRDFHAANLMIDGSGALRIIDHQDARIGSPAYDLVSLLLDRVTELPTPEWLAQKRRLFLDARENIGLDGLDENEFADEFRLQTIQRCLKAAGTFSYQSANRGKTYFTPFIKPMFRIVLRAAEKIGEYPVIQRLLKAELD